MLLDKMGYGKSLITASFVPIGGIDWIRPRNRNHFLRLCSAILARLTKLPIRFFFVFDGHGEGQQFIKQLRQDYGKKVQILSRYEIENYLLEPAAIVEAIKEEAGLYCEDGTIKAEIISNANLDKIEKTFERGKRDVKNYVNAPPDFIDWEQFIRGSSLLDSIYGKCRLSYNKRTSGPRIANHLSPEFIDKIKKEFHAVFKTIVQKQ